MRDDRTSSDEDRPPARCVKTRQDVAAEYGISPRTLRRRLQAQGLKLPSGRLVPADLARIYRTLGPPPFPKGDSRKEGE